MNKYKFADYKLSGFFNNDYAIEPEISKEFYKKHFEEGKYKTGHHTESRNIYELVGVHIKSEKEIKEIHELIQGFYKDKFPTGANSYLSGGVHFHVFNGTIRSIEWNPLKDKLLNLPLHCKVKNYKLYSRRLGYRSGFGMNQIYNGSKSNAVTYKNSYSTSGRCGGNTFRNKSIEFRCNNVFDARIYGYYIGIIIAAKESIEFEQVSEGCKIYAQEGNKSQYNSNVSEYKLSEITGYRMSDQDTKAIENNCNTLLELLQNHGLPNAALALKEYLEEAGIVITADVYARDSYNQERFKGNIIIEDLRIARISYGECRFNSENNFYDFIVQELKLKMKGISVAQGLYDINMEGVKKKFNKYLINQNTNDTEGQEQLFECSSVLSEET